MHFSQRHLPHLRDIGQPVFITFRLHGSLPAGREFPRMCSGKAFAHLDRVLESNSSGPTHLATPNIAKFVADAIQQGSRGNYDLHAWVIMPNHVHLLITPRTGLAMLLKSLKGSSARHANQLLGRTGTPFWQSESYDHVVRNSTEFDRIAHYITQNPVKAGLVQSAEEYPWSSATRPGGLKSAAG